ncbi:MAG: AraC family transcriptional regulator [Bacteroidota bacterium]
MEIAPDSFIAVVIGSFGILLCLLVGIQILTRRDGIRQANILLSALLILYSLTLMNSLLATTGVYSTYQYLYFIPIIFSLSIGPLFYFFVKARLQPAFRLERRHGIHFVLPMAQFLFYCIIGFRSAAYKSWVWQNVVSPYGQYIETVLWMALTLGYIIAALRLIRQEIPTAQWKVPIGYWLRRFAWSLLILFGISITYEVIDWLLWNVYAYNLFNTAWLDFPLKISQALVSIFIGYNAFLYQNQDRITPIYSQRSVPLSETLSTILSETTNSPQTAFDELTEQIEQLLTERQIYLDPEINLATMAKMLDVPRNNLSAYFSSRGESFRSQINQYRVHHFLKLIQAGKHEDFSILGLAYESGFNSKATFNRVFSDLQGKTPTQYIKSMQSTDSQ